MEPDRSLHARRWASATTTWLLAAGFVASFFGLLAWLGRPSASGGATWPTDGSWSLVAALSAAFGLGAAAGIWHARGSARRAAGSLAALVGAGERMLLGKTGPRIPAPPQPELAPLARLLNRAADLRDATSAVLADRDAQLSTIGRLSGLVYWEQDASGRYTRIEAGAGGRPDWIAGLLGRTRWETGGRALGGEVAGIAAATPETPGWDDHRAQMDRRAPIGDLVWSPPPVGGRSVFLREIGLPSYSEDGEFIGYRGVAREIGAEIGAERIAQNLAVAVAVSSAATLLIESSGNAVGWRSRWVNAACCALLGRTESEILELDPRELLGEGRDALTARIGQALRESRAISLDAELLDRYGEPVVVALRVDPMPPVAGLSSLATLSLDRFPAEAARLRERAIEAERRLTDAQRRASELEHVARELEAFSYSVSHDLRAPLRVVDGFARIVKEDYAGSLDHAGVDHLDRILSAATRMNQMIDALLRLARVSAEPISVETVDLSALARQVVDELRIQQPERQVDVEIGEDIKVEGDRTLLRLVLENLIGNAWKYSARQARARIEFSAAREAGATTVFCVGDNGAGFDMRFAQNLFRVFKRLHSADEFAGTGVGLATAARIIQRHGGRIWAESKPDEGARFYFSLQPDDCPRGSRAGDALRPDG